MQNKEDNIFNIEDLRQERKLIQNLEHLKKSSRGRFCGFCTTWISWI